LEAAKDELRVALRFARQAGDVAQQARCLTYMTMNARMRGQVAEAKEAADETERAANAAGMRDYVGAAHAHRAWCALREGNAQEALRWARAAVDTWSALTSFSYPFQWTALLPLIEVELGQGNIEKAISCLKPLLNTSQQLLPDNATEAMARAEEHWKSRAADKANEALHVALNVLKGTVFS
jgi:tetratricopeptide (TPR) repeat protein